MALNATETVKHLTDFVEAIKSNDDDGQAGLVHLFCKAIDDGEMYDLNPEVALYVNAAIDEEDDAVAIAYLERALAAITKMW